MMSRTQVSPPPGQRLSAVLAAGCATLAVLLPAVTLYALFARSTLAWQAELGVGQPHTADTAWPIDLWQIHLAIVLGMVPVSAMAYGLMRACLCFRGFLAGKVFSAHTVRHLRGFAAGVLGAALAEVAARPVLTLLLSWQAPAGQRQFAIDLGSQALLFLMFGAIVWQFAQVMSQAADIAEDNAQIV